MTKIKPRAPYVLLFFFVLLIVITGGLAAFLAHGLVIDGWMLPYWYAMPDAHAAIYAQGIFFLAAAWASVLVPLLFGEQLRNLQEAAERAQETHDEIRAQLVESVAESKRQFASISRYQQMALGYFAGDGLLSQLEDPSERRAFIDNAWPMVLPKLMEAIERLHGSRRNSINANRFRSFGWWERVKDSDALGDCYPHFKTISDVKTQISKGAVPTFEQLKAVNDALRAIRDFSPASSGDGVEAEIAPVIPPSLSNTVGNPLQPQ